jgi:phosphate transport system substrate-binding protein
MEIASFQDSGIRLSVMYTRSRILSMIPISHKKEACVPSPLRSLLYAAALAIWLCGGTGNARAQSAESLSHVKKLYVEPMGQGDEANRLRERLIDRLRKDGIVEVVATASQADAVLKGNESVWVTGYVSTDPRGPSIARQAISHGFLSAEVIGKDDETLWSYLVTPVKFRAGSITQDLADHLAAKLLAALKEKPDNTPVSSAPASSIAMKLDAAGATFPAPLYQKWFASFQERNPKAHISYRAVGSEEGLRLLADGKVDFAASDVPLSNERMTEWKAQPLHFPTTLGAVVPIYNLKGVERNLKFTPEGLVGIYLGKIKSWNDPLIRDSNRSAPLPNTDIVVIHRSDGSGTTFAWTDYLSKVSSEWKTTVGTNTLVRWPVGEGVEGNDAVASLVQRTPNSIGYVELVYALRHELSFGAVRNAAGEFVQADLTSLTLAARGAAGTMTSDFRVSITNAPDKGAYPISTFTWWLVPHELGGADKKPAFLDLLQWMLTSGQKECSALGYAPLPREIASRELQFLSSLK